MIEAVIRTLTNTPLYPYWLYARRVDYFLFSDLLRRARGEVLDVGCGPRSYEQWIKQLCAVTGYTGLDMFHWDPAAASARQHRTSTDSLGDLLNADSTLSASPDVQTDAHQLGIKNGSADTVIALGILEHIHTPSVVIAEIFRVLRPGGSALITYPFLHPVHGGVDGDADYYRYTRAAIGRLLTEVGFTDIEVAERGRAGTSLATLFNGAVVQVLRRLLGSSRGFVALLPAAAVLFAISQLAGLALDRLDRSVYFPSNYQVVARRRGP